MSNLGPAIELPRVLIVGGGGHATVVADCIRATRRAWVAGYCDSAEHDPSPMARLGVPWLGDDATVFNDIGALSIRAAVLGLAGIEHGEQRRTLVARFSARVSNWWTAVHPHATVAESARVGMGTVIFAGAVVNPLAQIGRHVVINTAAVIEHECVIEDFAVISPHATLCGGVRVGAGAFVGAGATVLGGVSIGAGAIVGAGSVVLQDVPDGATVVGNPARIIRRLAAQSRRAGIATAHISAMRREPRQDNQ